MGDTDHRDTKGASFDHRVERGKDHLVREIARRTEEHERIGRPAPSADLLISALPVSSAKR